MNSYYLDELTSAHLGTNGWEDVQGVTKDWMSELTANGLRLDDISSVLCLHKIFNVVATLLNQETFKGDKAEQVDRFHVRKTAVVSGGVATAAVHWLRSETPATFCVPGLDMVALQDAGMVDRAAQIIDVTSGASMSLQSAELRAINAQVGVWALEATPPPAADALVRRWVRQLMYEVWLVEAGRHLSRYRMVSDRRHEIEEHACNFLTNRLGRHNIVVTGDTPAHFEESIRELLREAPALLGLLSKMK